MWNPKNSNRYCKCARAHHSIAVILHPQAGEISGRNSLSNALAMVRAGAELIEIFKESDEKFAKRIARQIVKEREKRVIKTTLHLVQIIKDALPFQKKGELFNNRSPKSAYWVKPAMRVFQALRIRVNSELSSLQKMLPQALETLQAGGRLVIISYHSGEDRLVKNYFKKFELKGTVKILTKKVLRPGEKEIKTNLRARSAKLRVVEKM